MHDIDHGYESMVFIAMNDSFSRKIVTAVSALISVMILVLLLRWFTIHKDYPSVGFLLTVGYYIFSMFSIFCNMTN